MESIPVWAMIIPIAPFLFAAFDRWMNFKTKKLEIATREAAEDAARCAAQTERLEQRVRVLERLITDKGLLVATEIDDLRHAPFLRMGEQAQC